MAHKFILRAVVSTMASMQTMSEKLGRPASLVSDFKGSAYKMYFEQKWINSIMQKCKIVAF